MRDKGKADELERRNEPRLAASTLLPLEGLQNELIGAPGNSRASLEIEERRN